MLNAQPTAQSGIATSLHVGSQEGSASQEAAERAVGVAGATILGLPLESPLVIGAVVLVSLALAAAVWLVPEMPWLLVGMALFAAVMREDDKVLPVAEGQGGSRGKGALGVVLIGVACVVCCLPPVAAFGGVALGVAAGAGGWLVGLSTLAIAAVVALPILIVAAVLAYSAVTKSRRLAKHELHRLS